MLLQPERRAAEGAGHVEGGIAVFETAVAERNADLALRHEPAVEIRDPEIGAGAGHCFLLVAVIARSAATKQSRWSQAQPDRDCVAAFAMTVGSNTCE